MENEARQTAVRLGRNFFSTSKYTSDPDDDGISISDRFHG
jgi:hypothetical protein